MSDRILLLEHAFPLMARPNQWNVEMVTPQRFGEDLIESYIANTEGRYKQLTEALLEAERLDEKQVAAILSGFKDAFVTELREAHQQKRMRASGPAQVENEKNGNGRMYPTALWDRVLGEGSEFTTRLNNRQVLGELEHPAEGNTKLPRVSHLVEKVWRKEGIVYASHLIFRTPNGQIIEELYTSGAVPGVSSRGAGSTKSIDGMDVVEASDFHLDTWDYVAQPSVSTARPSRIGESGTGEKTPVVSEIANSAPIIVNTTEPMGEQSMTQLTESTEAVVMAGAALEASQVYLNSGQLTLTGLIDHQQKVVAAMGGLSGAIPEELAGKANQVRAAANEHIQTLRREIRRIAEAAHVPDNFKPKDDTETNGDTSNSGDGGGNNATPGNKKKNGEKDDTEESLAQVLGLESLKDVTATDIIEELAGRNRDLRAQAEGHVPEEKYRTAIDLGEAVVARANSDREIWESRVQALTGQLVESQRQQAASRMMLEATITRYRGEKVDSVVETLIVKNPQLAVIEVKLRECRTVPEIRELIEGIVKPLSEGVGPIRSDLPATIPTALNESVSGHGATSPATAAQPSGKSSNLMGMLAESEQRGYPNT